MNRFVPAHLLVMSCLAFASSESSGQLSETDRLKLDLAEGRSRLTGERVSRQVEVIRLERMIDRLHERVTRLERSSLRTTEFPAITVMEGEATLRYAETRLTLGEQLRAKGELSEEQLAYWRLAAIRAQAQLELAKAAHEERTLNLELDVIRAERRLAEEKQTGKQLEQLMARGYGSVENLELQKLEVAQAQKELRRARARLQLQQKLGGTAPHKPEISPASPEE